MQLFDNPALVVLEVWVVRARRRDSWDESCEVEAAAFFEWYYRGENSLSIVSFLHYLQCYDGLATPTDIHLWCIGTEESYPARAI